MSIALLFASDSLTNNTISCDSLGIHYEISRTQDSVVSIQRWESKTNQITPLYEVKMPCFSKDLYRRSDDANWQPVNQLLYKTSRNPFSNAKEFRGTYGQEYRWEVRRGKLQMSSTTEEKSNNKTPLVRYNRACKRDAVPSLEILDSSLLQSLDIIIRASLNWSDGTADVKWTVTFLISEKRRRIRNRRRIGAAIAAGAAA